MYNRELKFHFCGIGGAGMSGLAEILLANGFGVSGSDMQTSSVCERLMTLGATICYGHSAVNVPADASLVVYSSAIRPENPELEVARTRGLPIIRRAEVLAELMRLKFGVGVAGSHGKTTTTSLIASVLEQGGLDPTVVIGGQLQNKDSGSRVGKSDFLVAETDESDRSFLLMKPTVAVVTTIDAEHMEAYSSLDDLENSFASFAKAVPFYGLAIFGIDCARVRNLASSYNRRSVTYGVSPDAQLQVRDITVTSRGTEFVVKERNGFTGKARINLIGRHLAVNALAAVAVGLEFGLAPAGILEGLAHLQGVKRRLELLGHHDNTAILTDYGHHPVEIRATLKAVREAYGEQAKISVFFQPHRYSRTKDCFPQFLDAFKDCNQVFLSEVYAASETPIEGISGKKLCEALLHENKQFCESSAAVHEEALKLVGKSDVILFLGAGSVGSWGNDLITAISSEVAIAQ